MNLADPFEYSVYRIKGLCLQLRMCNET